MKEFIQPIFLQSITIEINEVKILINRMRVSQTVRKNIALIRK